MIQPNLEEIQQWNAVPINELGNMLKGQGFQFAKNFSHGDHRIFVAQDGSMTIVIDKNQAKVYSSKDRKNALHAFSIVPEGGIPQGNDKAFRTGR